ncbi:hypothetical protein JNUCC42_09160 [Brevibacterium sp. JNUCC-42]|nr:hypothetical protein JNUCC42_09160 [Brevibacterium sp. JNUCC-42]
MKEAVINIVLQQGPFAALFVWLLFSTKKEGREKVKPDWFSNCSRCMAKESRVVPKYTYSTDYHLYAVAFNVGNAYLFGRDFLEAGKLAFIEATAAIGIHSGLKNSLKEGK